MIDLNSEIPSTVIDNDAPAPGAAEYRPEPITPEPAAEKPMSLEDAVKQAAAETKDKAEAEEPKAKAEAKAKEPKAEVKPVAPKPEKATPDRGEGGKFTAKTQAEPEPTADAAEGAEVEQERVSARPSEARDTTRAPAHFLPRAKEAWSSTNEDVRAEVHRMVENYEKGLNEYKESHEKWKPLREFEQIAKSAGTTVPDYLKSVYAIDQLIRTNPVEGIKRVLATANITPEQYARHVIGQSEQQRQQGGSPEMSQMQQMLAQVQKDLAQERQERQQERQDREQEKQLSEVANRFIIPFKAEPGHERYDELEGDIAFFLTSGKIPSNLSERERLDAAYDMAERINPAGLNAEPEPLKPAQNAQRPLNPAGSKSIKGNLTYGAEVPRKSAKLSLDEALKMAARSVHG